MKRSNQNRKVVDLGVATRETKGGFTGVADIAGRQPLGGLSND